MVSQCLNKHYWITFMDLWAIIKCIKCMHSIKRMDIIPLGLECTIHIIWWAWIHIIWWCLLACQWYLTHMYLQILTFFINKTWMIQPYKEWINQIAKIIRLKEQKKSKIISIKLVDIIIIANLKCLRLLLM